MNASPNPSPRARSDASWPCSIAGAIVAKNPSSCAPYECHLCAIFRSGSAIFGRLDNVPHESPTLTGKPSGPRAEDRGRLDSHMLLGLPSVLPLHARPSPLRMDITVPSPAPAVPFAGGNVCCIDKLLGEGKACFKSDRSLGFCEFLPVQFHSNADGSVRLSAGDGKASGVLLPLAHQWDAGDAECPSRFAPAPSAAVAADKRAAPALLLGACVLVVDESENDCTRVLLTRRARHMRTFPGAWVPPGFLISIPAHPFRVI